jgi:hypothetical protein
MTELVKAIGRPETGATGTQNYDPGFIWVRLSVKLHKTIPCRVWYLKFI